MNEWLPPADFASPGRPEQLPEVPSYQHHNFHGRGEMRDAERNMRRGLVYCPQEKVVTEQLLFQNQKHLFPLKSEDTDLGVRVQAQR